MIKKLEDQNTTKEQRIEIAKELEKISTRQLKRNDERLLYKIDLVLKGLKDDSINAEDKHNFRFRLFK